VARLASVSDDGMLLSVAWAGLLQPVDLVFRDVGSDRDGILESVDDSDDRHNSRTDLTRAQWNVKMNKPCRLTPTTNTTCSTYVRPRITRTEMYAGRVAC